MAISQHCFPPRLEAPQGQRVNLLCSLWHPKLSTLVDLWHICPRGRDYGYFWSCYYFPCSDFSSGLRSSLFFPCHLGFCVGVCWDQVAAFSVFTAVSQLFISASTWFSFPILHNALRAWTTLTSLCRSVKCLGLIFFHFKVEITQRCWVTT